MLMSGLVVIMVLIALFYIIGGPPRKFRYKLLDTLQAYIVIALFFVFMTGAYKLGKDVRIGDVTLGASSILIGILIFWLLVRLYKYWRTPKHLRSSKLR